MPARRNRSEWKAIIGTFEGSGDSHEGFCSKHRLRIGTFRWWLYELRRTSVVMAGAPLMLPVEVTTPAPPRGRSELVVAVAGAEVRFDVGTDIGYVAELVAELRSRC